MDKQAKVGYMMTLEDAMKFWQRRSEAEKALGQKLTREESEKLLQAMKLGQELSLEEALEVMKDKKTLIVKDQNADSL
jgi:hypothetical protein